MPIRQNDDAFASAALDAPSAARASRTGQNNFDFASTLSSYMAAPKPNLQPSTRLSHSNIRSGSDVVGDGDLATEMFSLKNSRMSAAQTHTARLTVNALSLGLAARAGMHGEADECPSSRPASSRMPSAGMKVNAQTLLAQVSSPLNATEGLTSRTMQAIHATMPAQPRVAGELAPGERTPPLESATLGNRLGRASAPFSPMRGLGDGVETLVKSDGTVHWGPQSSKRSGPASETSESRVAEGLSVNSAAGYPLYLSIPESNILRAQRAVTVPQRDLSDAGSGRIFSPNTDETLANHSPAVKISSSPIPRSAGGILTKITEKHQGYQSNIQGGTPKPPILSWDEPADNANSNSTPSHRPPTAFAESGILASPVGVATSYLASMSDKDGWPPISGYFGRGHRQTSFSDADDASLSSTASSTDGAATNMTNQYQINTRPNGTPLEQAPPLSENAGRTPAENETNLASGHLVQTPIVRALVSEPSKNDGIETSNRVSALDITERTNHGNTTFSVESSKIVDGKANASKPGESRYGRTSPLEKNRFAQKSLSEFEFHDSAAVTPGSTRRFQRQTTTEPGIRDMDLSHFQETYTLQRSQPGESIAKRTISDQYIQETEGKPSGSDQSADFEPMAVAVRPSADDSSAGKESRQLFDSNDAKQMAQGKPGPAVSNGSSKVRADTAAALIGKVEPLKVVAAAEAAATGDAKTVTGNPHSGADVEEIAARGQIGGPQGFIDREPARVASLKMELETGGLLHANVREHSGRVEVRMITDDSQAANELSGEIHTLRRSLDVSGLKLDGAQVTYQDRQSQRQPDKEPDLNSQNRRPSSDESQVFTVAGSKQ
jgi:hypothetical protein